MMSMRGKVCCKIHPPDQADQADQVEREGRKERGTVVGYQLCLMPRFIPKGFL